MRFLVYLIISVSIIGCINNSEPKSKNESQISSSIGEYSSVNTSSQATSSNGLVSSSSIVKDSIGLSEKVSSPAWVYIDTNVIYYNILTHNEVSKYVVRQKLDSVCRNKASSEGKEWRLPEKDSIWYQINDETLKIGYSEMLSFTIDYNGNNMFEGKWFRENENLKQTLEIDAGSIVETTITEVGCYADDLVFSGSSSERISCSTVKIPLNGLDFKISGGNIEYGSAVYYELNDLTCLVEFEYSHSEDTCKELEAKLSGDCSEVFEKLEAVSPNKTKVCSLHELDDGVCKTDCINLDVDPDC